MKLQEEINMLHQFKSESKSVITVYLNTNPADLEQRNDAWKIHLKNGIKELDSKAESLDDKVVKQFNESKQKVVNEIHANEHDLNKGIIIFACEEPELWSVHYVQVPVKTGFYLGDFPELEQLTYMNKAYPNAGIILPSLDRIRILDTSMGVIHDELFYEFESGSEEWKEKQGLAYGAVRASGAKHVDDYDQRMKENLLRFFKKMSATVDKLKKERKWEEIHISGETELANAFTESLRMKPNSCLTKNLINRQPQHVLEEVFEK